MHSLTNFGREGQILVRRGSRHPAVGGVPYGAFPTQDDRFVYIFVLDSVRRWREFLEWIGTKQRFEDIYVTEQVSPFYRAARRRFPNVTGSEFMPDRTLMPGIRHEDLTQLSFEDSSFDVVCTADVLEHVPRYELALSECFRCLKPGGAIFISVPFMPDSEKTLVRARVKDDGTIEHLLPEEYHGDGLNPSGILCFYHFGWDLLARLSAAGFEKPDVAFYWSRERGYLGSLQCVIEAHKPKA